MLLLPFRRLGAGGFGKVYLIKHKADGKKYAAKYQKLNSAKMKKLVCWLFLFCIELKFLLQVHEETMFLKDLSEGKRVVDIYDYYEKDHHSLMVLEYLAVSTLTELSLGFSAFFVGWRVVC